MDNDISREAILQTGQDNILKWNLMSASQFRNFMSKELGIKVKQSSTDLDPDFVTSVKEKLLAGITDVPIDLTSLSVYDDQGYRDALIAVTRIPYGQTRTYSEIAEIVKQEKSDSNVTDYAVGNALRRNPVPLLVPCHRVVLGPDDPGKWGYGNNLKVKFLEHESRLVSN